MFGQSITAVNRTVSKLQAVSQRGRHRYDLDSRVSRTCLSNGLHTLDYTFNGPGSGSSSTGLRADQLGQARPANGGNGLRPDIQR